MYIASVPKYSKWLSKLLVNLQFYYLVAIYYLFFKINRNKLNFVYLGPSTDKRYSFFLHLIYRF